VRLRAILTIAAHVASASGKNKWITTPLVQGAGQARSGISRRAAAYGSAADDGQPDLPSGGHAELPGGGQCDYLV